MFYNVTEKGNLKQWFVLNQVPRSPAGWLLGDLDLVFSSSYDLDDNLVMEVDGNVADRGINYITKNDIWFYDPTIENMTDNFDELVFVIETPFGYDSAESQIYGETRLLTQGGNAYVEKMFNASWILDSARVFPIFLDASVLIDGTTTTAPVRVKSKITIIPSDDAPP